MLLPKILPNSILGKQGKAFGRSWAIPPLRVIIQSAPSKAGSIKVKIIFFWKFRITVFSPSTIRIFSWVDGTIWPFLANTRQSSFHVSFIIELSALSMNLESRISKHLHLSLNSWYYLLFHIRTWIVSNIFKYFIQRDRF